MHVTIATVPEADTYTRAEAARRLGIKAGTLARWAQQGRGPAYSLTGERKGRAIYTAASIAAWVEQKRVNRS
jgi:excisionase family DNA binding protein